MPELPDDPAKPWLDSLVVCALADEAETVRRLLRDRGLTTRAVPSGRAKLAWTCVDGDRIHGLVVSGVGAEAARVAATFWMHRARRLAVLGVAAGTGLTRLPATAIEGEEGLVARARTSARADEPPVVETHVAAAAPRVYTAEARRSLADAGVAATLPEVDVWREAARIARAEAIVVAGLYEPLEVDARIVERVPVGAAGPSVVRTVLDAALRPGDRDAVRSLEQVRGRAARPAARLALASLGVG
jgi:hypothetical protein